MAALSKIVFEFENQHPACQSGLLHGMSKLELLIENNVSGHQIKICLFTPPETSNMLWEEVIDNS